MLLSFPLDRDENRGTWRRIIFLKSHRRVRVETTPMLRRPHSQQRAADGKPVKSEPTLMMLEGPLSCLPSPQLPGLELEEPYRPERCYGRNSQGRVRDQVLAYCVTLRLSFLICKITDLKGRLSGVPWLPRRCRKRLYQLPGPSACQVPEAVWLLQPQFLHNPFGAISIALWKL